MGASVQFIGRVAVLKAFEKKDCAKWSFWCGKEMITAYEGNDDSESRQELEDWLTMMRGNTTALYNLRFYADSVKKVTPSTPHDTSFGFRLAEEQQGVAVNGVYGMDPALATMLGKINETMKGFEERLKKAEQPAGEEPLEQWEKLLDHPVVIAGIGKLFNIDVNAALADAPAKVGGIPRQVDEVLEGLRKHDAQFDKHMEKLLEVAEKKPAQFKLLLSMLDSMKL